MRSFSLLVVAWLAACVSDPEVEIVQPPPPGPPTGGDVAVDGHTSQGRMLLGNLDTFTAPARDYYAVSTPSTAALTIRARQGMLEAVERGVITHTGNDPWFKNQLFTGRFGGGLQILNVLPPTDQEPLRYTLQYVPPGGKPPWDPCDGEPAIAISGRYDAHRHHAFTSDSLTFSCKSGVVYKCHRWGYPDPGDPDDEMWDVQQACTFMANADYSGSGSVNTREGTYIGFFDAGPWGVSPPVPDNLEPWQVHSWPPPHDEYYIEGAWTAHGAKCLSKARWASLPVDGPRVGIDDPRTISGARYCEDFTRDELTSDDIKLLSTSKFNDLRLVTWATPSGDQVSTVRGYYDPMHLPPAGVDLPYPVTVPPVPGMHYVRSSGVLLRSMTSELIEQQVPMSLVSLYCMPDTSNSCVTPSARCAVTTADLQPPLHTCPCGPEGFVFQDQRVNTIPLIRYRNADGDYLSSTVSPGPGYIADGLIGYVMPEVAP